jgi:hypothetical protein
LGVSSDDPEVIVAALRSPRGQTTLYLLNKSVQQRDVSLKLAGVTEPLSCRRYQVTEADVTKPSFALTSLGTVNAGPADQHFTVILPGKSLTAYTTFQLADDADGITQE